MPTTIDRHGAQLHYIHGPGVAESSSCLMPLWKVKGIVRGEWIWGPEGMKTEVEGGKGGATKEGRKTVHRGDENLSSQGMVQLTKCSKGLKRNRQRVLCGRNPINHSSVFAIQYGL